MYLQALNVKPSTSLVPFFSVPVPAGPGQSIEQQPEWVNLYDFLRAGSDSVAFLKVYGDSMEDVRIYEGDILVVHRTDCARAGDVVIADVNGEFTVKRLMQHSHGLYLVPANDKYPVRKIHRNDQFTIWGIVTGVVHQFQRVA